MGAYEPCTSSQVFSSLPQLARQPANTAMTGHAMPSATSHPHRSRSRSLHACISQSLFFISVHLRAQLLQVAPPHSQVPCTALRHFDCVPCRSSSATVPSPVSAYNTRPNFASALPSRFPSICTLSLHLPLPFALSPPHTLSSVTLHHGSPQASRVCFLGGRCRQAQARGRDARSSLVLHQGACPQ